MNTFESSLLDELREHVTTRSEVRHRRRRWAWAAVPAGAVAATAGVAAVLLPSTAAYAVTKQSQGDVVVTITKLSDASGLQKALRANGIDAHVDYQAVAPNLPLPSPGGNPTIRSGSLSSSGNPEPGGSLSSAGPAGPSRTEGQQSGCGTAGPISVKVQPDKVTFDIPASDVGTKTTLYVTTSGSQTGLSGLQMRWQC